MPTRTKGSQTGAVTIVVPAADVPSARDTLARWSAVARLKAGDPVFRRVSALGEIGTEHLTDRSIARIVKARMAAF